MEKKRANDGVDFLAYGDCVKRAGTRERGFSAIGITAALSAVLLLCVALWQIEGAWSRAQLSASNTATPQTAPDTSTPASPNLETAIASSPESGASSTDPVSAIGPAVIDNLIASYAQMRRDGTYSTQAGTEAAQTLLPLMQTPVSYAALSPAGMKTDPDTSYARMMRYRADLQTALSPIAKNTEPEFEIFAYYVETKDPSYLSRLKEVAQAYRDAASSTAHVVAPEDAVSVHAGIVNAMQEFGATLDGLAAHADDPFASVALLRSYDQAESDMLAAFQALVAYEKSKLS